MAESGNFYKGRPWRRIRMRVLREFHGECQICLKKPGHPHVKATIVHHVYHLEDYPEWGLSEYVSDPKTGDRRRNLLPVCKDCHETVCHPDRLRKAEYIVPLTTERW